MRQEPVAYIGGLPVALRKPESPHTNIEVSDKELDAMEVSESNYLNTTLTFRFQVKLVKEIQTREKDGTIEVHKDAGFAENPMDREDVIEKLKLEGLKGLNDILKSLSESALPGLSVVSVPFNEQRAMPLECFDVIVKVRSVYITNEQVLLTYFYSFQALSAENAATTQVWIIKIESVIGHHFL